MKTTFFTAFAITSALAFAFASSAFAALPAEYGELPWIQSDGASVIDTGYHLKSTTRLEIDVDMMDQGGDYFPFGASDVKYGGDSAKMQLWWESYNNNGGGYVGTPGKSGYYTKTSGAFSLSTSEYRNCQITYESGVVTIVNPDYNATCVYNGSAEFASSDPSYVFINTLHLFCRKGSGSSTDVLGGKHNKSRFRRVKAYESNTLVMDLVPCYIRETGRITMYDLIGNTLVSDPTGAYGFSTDFTGNRKRLAYIGSTNAGQYIDTGYVFKVKPRVECGMYLNCTTDTDIMGTKQAAAGCFIIDINDGSTTMYYRYSTSASTGGKNYNSAFGSLRNRWTDCVFSDKVTIDGVEFDVGVTSWDFSENLQTFHVLNGRYENECVRFSWMKMYDGDVLVRDYIPAEINGVVGFYDKLTQTLYPNAGKGTLEAGGVIPPRVGDFTILTVTGFPREIGTVTPAYGTSASADGGNVNISATAPADSDTERSRLVGWELYYDGVLQTNDTTAADTIICGPGTTELRWLWAGEYMVCVTNASHGTCTQTNDWIASGTELTLSATPDSGYEFMCWSGDVAEEDKYANPLSVTVSGATNIRAKFCASSAKRLEYIGSDNQQQWIDTGYVPTNKPAVVARAMFNDTNDKDFVGMASANANCFMVDYADGNKTLYYRYAAAGYTAAGYANLSGALTGKWFDFAWSNIVWHGEYKIHTVAAGWEGGFAANKQSIRLFGGRSFGKIYYGPVKIYDGDELVRDLIPAKINGIAGMWDRVGRNFYSNMNANRAPFVEGPMVEIEDDDFTVTHVVTASDGGSAAVSDINAPMGELVTLTATPDSGHVFVGWEGNVPAVHVANPNPTFIVTAAITARAMFAQASAYVVDPAGEGDFTTITDALEATAASVGTIKIKSGFYEIPELIHVTGSVSVEAESGVTGDVVLWSTNRNPIISVENTLARLSHLVISNGYSTSSTPNYGGNVTIAGGTVENCLIVNGHNGTSQTYGDKAASQGGPAAGVYLTEGTLRNSTVRGNFANYDAPGKAVGIFANGANTLVDGCVVCCNTNLNNYNINNLYHASAIKLSAGAVRNCVITNNVNLGHATIYVSDGGTVEDTLVKDNIAGFYFDTLSGGAFVPSGHVADFTRCTFTGNSGFGVGGIYNAGTVHLTDVHCYGNTCAATGFEGEPNVRGVNLANVDLTDPREVPEQTVDVYVVPGDDISAAVERCAEGGTVHIAAGDYSVTKEIFIDRAITLQGEGYDRTSIYVANNAPYSRAVNLRDDGIVIEGLAITNGSFLAANCVNVARGTVENCLIGHSTRQGALIIWNGKVQNSVIQKSNGSSTYCEYGTAVDLAGADALLEDSLIESSKQGGNVNPASDVIRIKNGLMRRCEIRGNSADGNGTAVVGMAGGKVENCVIHDNDSSWNGAGMFRAAGNDWDVRNCTVVSNKAWFGGAVWWATNGATVARSGRFVNTIFRGNWSKVLTANQQLEDLGEVFPGNGTKGIDVVFSSCCFETSATIANQGARAVNCIAADPLFKNLADRDFRLGGGSPCRSKGVIWEGARDATDPNGRPLVGCNMIDIGAYSASKLGFKLMLQ